MSADAAGVFAKVDDRLELISASAHDTSEMALHEILTDGPYVEASEGRTAVTAWSAAELVTRWPGVGPLMVESGFLSVHAAPLRWHSTSIGAIGMLRRSATPFDESDQMMAQTIADIATAIIVHSEIVQLDVVAGRVRDVLGSRVLIEQAKGVLADQHELDMHDAYDLLLHRSEESGRTLSAEAEAVIWSVLPGG